MGRIIAALVLAGIVVIWMIVESYRSPMCPKCKHDLYCSRIKGRVICSVHGDVTSEFEFERKRKVDWGFLLLVLLCVVLLVRVASDPAEEKEEAQNAKVQKGVDDLPKTIRVSSGTIKKGPNAGIKIYWVNDQWGYKSIQFIDACPVDDIIDQIVLSGTNRIEPLTVSFDLETGFISDPNARVLYSEDGDEWIFWLGSFEELTK